MMEIISLLKAPLTQFTTAVRWSPQNLSFQEMWIYCITQKITEQKKQFCSFLLVPNFIKHILLQNWALMYMVIEQSSPMYKIHNSEWKESCQSPSGSRWSSNLWIHRIQAVLSSLGQNQTVRIHVKVQERKCTLK